MLGANADGAVVKLSTRVDDLEDLMGVVSGDASLQQRITTLEQLV